MIQRYLSVFSWLVTVVFFCPVCALGGPQSTADGPPTVADVPALQSETFMLDHVGRIQRPDRDRAGAQRYPSSYHPLSSQAGGTLCQQFESINDPPEGDMPRDVAFSGDGRFALIVNRDTDNVALFDVAKRETVALLAVGDFPVHVAVTPDGRRAVVPNALDHTVSVIDIEERVVVAHIPVTGKQPYRVAITSDSRLALVGVINTGDDASFSVIDLETLEEVRTFPSGPQGVIGGFFTPESGIWGNIYTRFALSPDDRTVVLPHRFGGRVFLYDLSTGEELASLETAAQPAGVDISRNGKIAVVTHEGSVNKLTKIDLIERRVSNEFTVSEGLRNQLVRITPRRKFAMVAALNHVMFIHLRTGQRSARIFTGSPGDIEFSFDNRFAFVSNATARVIDTKEQRVVASMPLGPCVEAATSPVDYIAVALNNRFREDVQVYQIDGPQGQALGTGVAGGQPEADAPRTLALTPDGRTVLAVNNTSDNLAIIDVKTGVVRDYVPTGKRSLGIAVSPDGRFAVVANAGDDTASVIDIQTAKAVATLSIADVPAEVLISPNGKAAYVTTVGGTDRVHFIKLDGADSKVVASLRTGQMGLVQYTFNVFSGMALSPNGSVLAICISFDDELLLIDTRSREELARVEVGDFPIRVAFSPKGKRAYVAHALSNDLYIIRVDGKSSEVTAIVEQIKQPLTVDVDVNGAFVYVGSFDRSRPAIHVVDTSSDTVVAVVELPGSPRATFLSNDPAVLYAVTTDDRFVRVRAAGPDSTLFDAVALTDAPSDMVYSESMRRAVVALPVVDGVDFVRLSAPGNFGCDDVVDLEDYRAFSGCLTGPAGGLPRDCEPADTDLDNDVDLRDFAAFQSAFTGS